MNLHIVPRIGRTKLAKLTRAQVEQFRTSIMVPKVEGSQDDEGNNEELPHLSLALARKVLTSLKSSLKHNGYAHVVMGVSIKRNKRERRSLEVGVDIPEPGEVKRLIGATTTPRQKALVLTAALTGLRASELRGLRWKDVDLSASELHVRQRADRQNKIGAPKSTSSIRSIPLAPELVVALKAWKIGCPKGHDGLVFPTGKGTVQDHANMLGSLETVMKAAHVVDHDGKPKYGLHALRHFFASWCINLKKSGGRELPPKQVQALLGHASIVWAPVPGER